MRPMGEELKRLLLGAGITFEADAEDEDWDERIERLEARKVEAHNRSRGALDASVYDCPECLNRGDTMRAWRDERGDWHEALTECRCMTVRRNYERVRKSGCAAALARCTLESFQAAEEWQRRMKEAAERYLADTTPGRWFFAGGAVGSGKTHLCTAIAGEMIKAEPLLYVSWPSEAPAIKALATDADGYAQRVERLKRAPVLYLDDLFKATRDRDGADLPPTGADVRLVHEILSYRDAAALQTIISSERYLSEILAIDEATGGRIAQRAKGYTLNISRDRARDYRMRIASGTI